MSKIEKSFEVNISKVDKDNKIVEGVVYRPSKEFDDKGNPIDYKDSQGDYMTEEDVKKACHSFAKKLAITKGNVVDKNHNSKGQYGSVVENYIAKTDIPEIGALKGDWCAAIEVTCDETFKQIEKQEITGFSIGGKAIKA